MNSTSVTFIAEIGLNHNGNFGLFFELIKQASLAGADFAKFQLGLRSGEGEMNQLGAHELELIDKCCHFHDIQPLFSIFTYDAWELAQRFDYDAYKIASRTVVDDKQLAEDILNAGKRTFVSLGMTDEIAPFGYKDNLEYLWCKSEYPALPWSLTDMPKDFLEMKLSGCSDHSIGIDVSLMAITRGAKVIEKHFTLDKSDTTIRDHALSSTPSEFKQMVQIGRAIRRNLDLGI